jgi:hypothetical protein
MVVKGNHFRIFCYIASIAICIGCRRPTVYHTRYSSYSWILYLVFIVVIPECGYLYLGLNDVYHKEGCHVLCHVFFVLLISFFFFLSVSFPV